MNDDLLRRMLSDRTTRFLPACSSPQSPANSIRIWRYSEAFTNVRKTHHIRKERQSHPKLLIVNIQHRYGISLPFSSKNYRTFACASLVDCKLPKPNALQLRQRSIPTQRYQRIPRLTADAVPYCGRRPNERAQDRHMREVLLC